MICGLILTITFSWELDNETIKEWKKAEVNFSETGVCIIDTKK